MISQQHYAHRRQTLAEKLLPGSIVFIPGAAEIIRNGIDNTFPFRQNSDLLYLTGFLEPDAILVLAPGRDEGETILFNRPKNSEQETWTGIRAGQKGACDHYGMDQSFDIALFTEKLPDLLNGYEYIYYPIGQNATFDQTMLKAFNDVRNNTRKGAMPPCHFANIETPLHEMRRIKSAEELELMRFANTVSSEAHRLVMQACKPGTYEYELEAIMRQHCVKHNMRDMAYSPIVGAGKNACILHYVENNCQANNGDMVLVDAGGEYQGYSSDITRTFPANGKFTTEQKALYEVVLTAQQSMINSIRPGTTWNTIQDTVAFTLTEGLIELGILKGNTQDLVETKAYRPYYMHLPNHWLGLDTHDVGTYSDNGKPVPLVPGMVTTAEPGLYITEGSDCDERWWNIGIRIEDNVIVTENGHENMTSVVKKVDEIEAVMAG